VSLYKSSGLEALVCAQQLQRNLIRNPEKKTPPQDTSVRNPEKKNPSQAMAIRNPGKKTPISGHVNQEPRRKKTSIADMLIRNPEKKTPSQDMFDKEPRKEKLIAGHVNQEPRKRKSIDGHVYFLPHKSLLKCSALKAHEAHASDCGYVLKKKVQFSACLHT
jgi:hypothetical protein